MFNVQLMHSLNGKRQKILESHSHSLPEETRYDKKRKAALWSCYLVRSFVIYSPSGGVVINRLVLQIITTLVSAILRVSHGILPHTEIKYYSDFMQTVLCLYKLKIKNNENLCICCNLERVIEWSGNLYNITKKQYPPVAWSR